MLRLGVSKKRKNQMIGVLVSLILNSIAVFVTAYILPGIQLDSFWTAMVVAVVLGLVNAIIRPILLLITLPINILTLGLFTFVIMGGLVMLVSSVVPGFYVASFWWAVAFAFILMIINSFISTKTFDY
jgi:Predicted membrane protein